MSMMDSQRMQRLREFARPDRVFDFMVAELGVAPDAASAEAMWRKEFQIHNQTLRALRHGLCLPRRAAQPAHPRGLRHIRCAPRAGPSGYA